MRAVAVFPSSREAPFIDVEEPQITRPAEVTPRMLAVGICGDDKESRSFQYGIPPDGSDYLILGHESLDEMVEVAPEARDLAVGDLAVTLARRHCSHAALDMVISGRYPLDAYRDLVLGQTSDIKNMLSFEPA